MTVQIKVKRRCSLIHKRVHLQSRAPAGVHGRARGQRVHGTWNAASAHHVDAVR